MKTKCEKIYIYCIRVNNVKLLIWMTVHNSKYATAAIKNDIIVFSGFKIYATSQLKVISHNLPNTVRT